MKVKSLGRRRASSTHGWLQLTAKLGAALGSGCRAASLEEGQLPQPSQPAVTSSGQSLLLGSCLSPAALGGMEGTALALAPNPTGLAVSPLLLQSPVTALLFLPS